MKPLIIRADASPQIGTGHVMRCLALGQAWQDYGGTVIFITTSDSAALSNRIRKEGMDWEVISTVAGSDADALLTISYAKKTGAGWVVVDGYHFNDTYLAIIRNAGLQILAIDDKASVPLPHADIVLNQNVYATPYMYLGREPGQTFLLGTKYALIRREFLRNAPLVRPVPNVATRILVTLGGSDPDNVTQTVIESVRDLTSDGRATIMIITGYSNPHYDTLAAAAAGYPGIQLIPPTEEMPGLMAWAEIAVTAAGSTVWEMALMGVPVLTLVIADNQLPVAEELEKLGAAVNLGRSNRITPEPLGRTIRRVMESKDIRQDLSAKIRVLVDGEGAARTVMYICQEKMRVRPVRDEDKRLLWQWANESTVRRMSFHEDPIPWEEHTAWFAEKLHDPSCFLFLAVTDNDLPVGQIRFDIDDKKALVDVSVDPRWRGKGYGEKIILAGIRRLRAEKPGLTIHAEIRQENSSSLHVFEKVGFVVSGTGQVLQKAVVFLVLQDKGKFTSAGITCT
ncbi:MAG: UDP-2,4-diacetamido-2,4,6-trideoxy-beta-L-altropyranose hydrolase [Methanoregula sp.]|nr:UDP-2,4-diacetamido-2,4,6-trideoxy-beta-L-altropyranose hydrolase [Methanoregula sp.]